MADDTIGFLGAMKRKRAGDEAERGWWPKALTGDKISADDTSRN